MRVKLNETCNIIKDSILYKQFDIRVQDNIETNDVEIHVIFQDKIFCTITYPAIFGSGAHLCVQNDAYISDSDLLLIASESEKYNQPAIITWNIEDSNSPNVVHSVITCEHGIFKFYSYGIEVLSETRMLIKKHNVSRISNRITYDFINYTQDDPKPKICHVNVPVIPEDLLRSPHYNSNIRDHKLELRITGTDEVVLSSYGNVDIQKLSVTSFDLETGEYRCVCDYTCDKSSLTSVMQSYLRVHTADVQVGEIESFKTPHTYMQIIKLRPQLTGEGKDKHDETQ